MSHFFILFCSISLYNEPLKKLVNYNENIFFISMRSTLLPADIEKMEDYVKFGISLGVNRVSFSSVLPSGKASKNKKLWMDSKELKIFSEKLQALHLKYKSYIEISSNEPLKWISRNLKLENKENVISVLGCPAGTITFNINSNGDMTPCSLLGMPIMNVLDLSIDEIEDKYKNSSIVHNLLDRNFSGFCGSCTMKNLCVGCRARAYYVNNDYLAEDPNCWLRID